MLATLVVISSLFQFLLAWRLSLLRRILTPTVAGTVIMLIPVTVMPIVFGMLTQVPADTPALAAPLSALVTALAIGGITLKATGVLRLWAPVIGIVAGCGVAGYFGLYDVGSIAAASWVGLPQGGWPGFDLDFGPVFWGLLPAFVFVTLVGAIETVGDGVAIQRVSWRKPRAVDFRAVQGAVSADGVGNLFSGLMGTVPNTTYSTSISVTALTGVGARSVGVALGVSFVVVAFIPKALAVVLAIPGPVAAAYITVLLGLLFVVGMRIIVQDGVDYRKGLIAGVSFWIGGRLPERRDLPRACLWHRRRAAGERHDGRRHDRNPAHALHGADGAPPAAHPGAVRGRVAAYDQGVPAVLRRRAAAGARRWRTDWMPPPRRRS